MTDKANDGILDRSLFRVQIKEAFSEQINLLEQIVNYGTNLVPRCYNSSDRKIKDIVAVLSFLKHAVTSLDAISILSREGSTLSCFPHIRSLFEIDLYLRWIFQKNYDRRGTAYFVWNIRRKRYWARCYLNGTAEQTAHSAHMEGALLENVSVPYNQKEIQKVVDHETARLSNPELASVNDLFESRMAHSGKDVEWYKPFGVNSIRDMAKQLGDEGTYKVFYTKYSQLTHGQSFEQQLHFDTANSVVVFDHIRTLQSIDEVFQMTLSFAFGIFRTVLEKYRPDELNAFNRKYMEEWQKPFMSIPKITKDGSTFSITQPKPRS